MLHQVTTTTDSVSSQEALSNYIVRVYASGGADSKYRDALLKRDVETASSFYAAGTHGIPRRITILSALGCSVQNYFPLDEAYDDRLRRAVGSVEWQHAVRYLEDDQFPPPGGPIDERAVVVLEALVSYMLEWDNASLCGFAKWQPRYGRLAYALIAAWSEENRRYVYALRSTVDRTTRTDTRDGRTLDKRLHEALSDSAAAPGSRPKRPRMASEPRSEADADSTELQPQPPGKVENRSWSQPARSIPVIRTTIKLLLQAVLREPIESPLPVGWTHRWTEQFTAELTFVLTDVFRARRGDRPLSRITLGYIQAATYPKSMPFRAADLRMVTRMWADKTFGRVCSFDEPSADDADTDDGDWDEARLCSLDRIKFVTGGTCVGKTTMLERMRTFGWQVVSRGMMGSFGGKAKSASVIGAMHLAQDIVLRQTDVLGDRSGLDNILWAFIMGEMDPARCDTTAADPAGTVRALLGSMRAFLDSRFNEPVLASLVSQAGLIILDPHVARNRARQLERNTGGDAYRARLDNYFVVQFAIYYAVARLCGYPVLCPEYDDGDNSATGRIASNDRMVTFARNYYGKPILPVDGIQHDYRRLCDVTAYDESIEYARSVGIHR